MNEDNHETTNLESLQSKLAELQKLYDKLAEEKDDKKINEKQEKQENPDLSKCNKTFSQLQNQMNQLSYCEPKPLSIPPKQIEKKFKVFAAIDFGTDGTGLAYCLPDNDEVYVHDKWKRWEQMDTRTKRSEYDECKVASIKPKTAILLDRDGDFIAFGEDALRMYMMMNDNKSLMFEHFKMDLYTKPHYKSKKIKNQNNQKEKSKIKDKLIALNGKKCDTSKVFIEALKYLKKQSLQVFKRNRLSIKSTDDVCWILSVPAIWDDIAKAKMRRWAIEAGMVNPSIKDHLLLRYEPDCASLSIMMQIKDKMNEEKTDVVDDVVDVNVDVMSEGDKYILLDAGGGTVDIACHEICGNFRVKELIHPSGGPWGDMHIDHYFIDILCKIFDKKWIKSFQKKEPNSYLKLLDNFRRAKQNYDDESKENTFNVHLPYEFEQFLEDKLEDGRDDNDDNDNDNDDDDLEGVEGLVNSFIFNGKKHMFELCNGSLKIRKDIWRNEFFNKLIDPTIAHCKDLLSNPNMVNCKYLCIVGGFGAIKYFQTRLSNAFGEESEHGLKVIIPERPILSVLDGAARMSMVKDYIQSRRLNYTYGIGQNWPESYALSMGYPSDLIDEKSFYCEYRREKYVANCFKAFAHKNEEIQFGQTVQEIAYRRPHDRVTTIKFYRTELEKPVMLNEDCVCVAELIIEWDNENKDDLQIKIEMHFYDTTIKVFVFNPKKASVRKNVELKYDIN